MKKFNKLIINSGDVLAEGMHKFERGYIFINTKNREMVSYFREIQNEKIILESLEFLGDEANANFSGSFIGESIHFNNHTLFFEIHIKGIK